MDVFNRVRGCANAAKGRGFCCMAETAMNALKNCQNRQWLCGFGRAIAFRPVKRQVSSSSALKLQYIHRDFWRGGASLRRATLGCKGFLICASWQLPTPQTPSLFAAFRLITNKQPVLSHIRSKAHHALLRKAYNDDSFQLQGWRLDLNQAHVQQLQ